MTSETIETSTIKITDIVPARYNPRKISAEDYQKLNDSISEYGLVDPIIININNNRIIGGHQRFDVLMNQYLAGDKDYETLTLIKRGDIGWLFINEDLVVKDLNHEKSLNITLNKVQGEWDSEKLEMLLNDLSTEGLDLSLTGWSKNEIKELSKEIDLSPFGKNGEALEDPLNDEEESKKEVSNIRNKKEISCPFCGAVFMEDEGIDE
ncbi:MAG: ParB N-terminal domain-containing protein [Methanobrevibacter sp.]|nr:ParB N-terminal domain-containing protein [Methanosphaera sp.]MBR0371047.1 ParB N-terminal domain-containing protein [Methanobrevibacter sp.]